MSDAYEAVKALQMFSGARQHQNFSNMKNLLPVTRMEPSCQPFAFQRGEAISLPTQFQFSNKAVDTGEFLERTETGGLLVLQNGQTRFEDYWLSGGPEVQWISWSVAKSFVSALVGIALHEGHIASIDQPISDYISVNPGSAYDGASIKSVLQMSSGARWNEDYGDPKSDINQFSAAMAGQGTFDAFIASLVPDKPPGSLCRYNSADTQALGSLLVNATGRSIADYMYEKLIEPLGFESPGYWLLDSSGREMAFGGLNLTARDFAKLGELYRCGGEWQGTQIVPREWVAASTRANEPHLQAEQVEVGGLKFGIGYGYQWWIPKGDRGEFTGIGIYNQFVYVDPSRALTIVKLTANPVYGSPADDHTSELQTIELLRAIARQCD
ncbi:MAG: serine hydrolase domain-containing protein [Pseudomonadales bacterium]